MDKPGPAPRYPEMPKRSLGLTPGNLRMIPVARSGDDLTVTAESREPARCPRCGTVSRSRHSRYERIVRDLPAQGAPV
jgi:transposase